MGGGVRMRLVMLTMAGALAVAGLTLAAAAAANSPETGGSPGVTLTVSPSDGLVNGQTVAVHGTGFQANTPVDLYQCTSDGSTCTAQLGSPAPTTDASGNFGPANVTVATVFIPSPPGPTVDCRIVSCALLGITTTAPMPKSGLHHLTFAGAVGAPTATTGDAAGIGSTTATLTGSVNPKGGSTTARFEYSTTPTLAGSTLTPVIATGAGMSDVPVSAGVAGLAPATTYYFRVTANSAGGTPMGAIKSFMTLPGTALSVTHVDLLDLTAPGVTGYGMANTTFAVTSASTPTFGTAAAKKPKKGTTVRYTLSEAATVTITITQRRPGRRRGKRCVVPTRALARAKKCTRVIVKGTLTRVSRAGANRVAFSGRIGRRALAPGKYQATLIATDAARNASRPRTISFKVVRP